MILEKNTLQLVVLFNQLFAEEYNVRLSSESDEPFYQPSDNDEIPHQLLFANGYFNSALHEIAHWVIAGDERRQLPDYGYWYAEDGRTPQQQQQFEQLEIYPQAIEKAFCEAIGRKFKASVDNLNSPLAVIQVEQFENNIEIKKQQLQVDGFPQRAQMFIDALSKEFN